MSETWVNLAENLRNNPSLSSRAIALDEHLDAKQLTLFETDTGYNLQNIQFARTEALVWHPFFQIDGTLSLISSTSAFSLHITGKRGARNERELVKNYAKLYDIKEYGLKARPLSSCVYVLLPEELKKDKPCWLQYTAVTKKLDGDHISEKLQVLYASDGKVRQTTLFSTEKGAKTKKMGLRVYIPLDSEKTEVCITDDEEPIRIRFA